MTIIRIRKVGLLAGVLLLAATGYAAEEGGASEAPDGRPAGCCGMCQAPGPAASPDGSTTPTVSPDRPMRQRRHGMDGRGGGGRGRGAHAETEGGLTHRGVMREAMGLVHAHTMIEREIEEIPGGVRTVTTTSDPSVLERLRSHPRNMDAYYDQGGSVRHWDPLFMELSKHHDKITMTFRDIENGIEVESISDDPVVTGLIRAHAAKVSEFVARGMAAVHEPSTMPEGDGASSGKPVEGEPAHVH
jgi:hypothetical protein